MLPADVTLCDVNKVLGIVGISPFRRKRRVWNQTYVGEKLQRVGDVLKKKVLFATGHEERETQDDGSEMIKQLKEKFAVASSRSEKLTILTILPKSWSVAKMMSEFGVTKYMASSAKKLVENKGVLSSPNSKAGKTLTQDTLELVKDFYHHDDVSRVMPGKKDFVSSRNDDGEKVHLQKRLVLCNLKEAYLHFKAKNCILMLRWGSQSSLS